MLLDQLHNNNSEFVWWSCSSLYGSYPLSCNSQLMLRLNWGWGWVGLWQLYFIHSTLSHIFSNATFHTILMFSRKIYHKSTSPFSIINDKLLLSYSEWTSSTPIKCSLFHTIYTAHFIRLTHGCSMRNFGFLLSGYFVTEAEYNVMDRVRVLTTLLV